QHTQSDDHYSKIYFRLTEKGKACIGLFNSIADNVQQGCTHQQPHTAGDGSDDQRFLQDKTDDGERLRTDRFAYTNLFGPLSDNDHHDIAHSDDTGNEGTDTNDPNEYLHGMEEAGVLQELLFIA